MHDGWRLEGLSRLPWRDDTDSHVANGRIERLPQSTQREARRRVRVKQRGARHECTQWRGVAAGVEGGVVVGGLGDRLQQATERARLKGAAEHELAVGRRVARVALAAQHLGRHVARRADDSIGERVRAYRGGDAEVCELDGVVRRQQDVGRLE
eukprot:5624878-Prymnesium_polylepis.1